MIRKHLPILVTVLLTIVPCFQSNAAEVLATRFNSEAHQTRIVVQLDEPANYQLQHDPKSSMLSIYLLKTRLGAIGQTTNIDDGLIKTLTLKEIMSDIVEVNILLEKYVCFNIFPLESPDRIAIDIAPMGLMESAEGAGMLSSAGEPVMENKNPSDSGSGVEAESDKMISFALPFRDSSLSFRPESYILFQLCLSILLAIAIIVVGLRLRKVTKISSRRSSLPGKSENFADMMIGSQELSRQKAELKAQDKTDHGSRITPRLNRGHGLRTTDPGKIRKMKAKKRRNARLSSPQKQYERVQELAKRGMSQIEISQQTNVPIGEVSLILGLIRTMPQENSN